MPEESLPDKGKVEEKVEFLPLKINLTLAKYFIVTLNLHLITMYFLLEFNITA